MDSSLREKIGNERRRLRKVRQALSAALTNGSAGNEVFVPFYIAIANYFEASMGRLHVQDVRMGEMIKEKLGDADPKVQQALKELDDRLSGNQVHLKNFLHSREELETSGAKGLENFEQVSNAYTDYITSSMGHHGATTELAADLFSQEDWVYMAGITDEDMEREQRLFDTVYNALPAGLEIPED